MEKGRVKLDWIAASEGMKVAETIKNFTQEIKQVGPNSISKSKIRK